MPVLPLTEFIDRVLLHGEPLSQNTTEGNLGFGWIYYGLVQNLRPDYVVAIGSRRGFMPFCAARAVQDNGRGHVLFIDPSYSGGGHPGWGGGDLWSNSAEVAERIAFYGLTGWITHLRMTSAEAFPLVRDTVGEAGAGVVIVDGSHTYNDSLQDFDLYSSLVADGFVVFHDSVSTWCDVPRTIHTLRTRGLPVTTVHREVGLTIVEVYRPPAVESTWGYLVRPSNRGRRIAEAAQGMFRAGDRVFDVYCGFSPLASVLQEVRIFGCDRDARIIGKLSERFPEHEWRPVDELFLPFADLPPDVDVLVGLGLSRGHAWWDPQHVLENVRYLLGRYIPGRCVFEAAADYYDAGILSDIELVLMRLGYACEYKSIDTDLDAFPVRKLLLALR